MATLKSHSGALKRFKVTKGKKVLFNKVGNNHLLTNKGKSNKANPAGKQLEARYSKKVKTLLPYS